MIKKAIIILILLTVSAQASEPIRNRYLDTSDLYWCLFGGTGTPVLMEVGFSNTSALITPSLICFLKEYFVDYKKNKISSLDEPDVIGFDGTDIAATLIGSGLGFIFKEIWDQRKARLSFNKNKITLAVML